MRKVIFLFGVFFFLSSAFVNAQTIVGVSPGDVDLRNVLRGGYAERSILVSVGSEENVKVSLEPRGEVADWLNFSSKEMFVSINNPARPIIYVRPPIDLPNGNYTGFLRVKTETIVSGANEGKATGNIIAVIDVALKIEITDLEIFSCQANNFFIETVEKGDNIRMGFDFANLGNVRVRPKMSVDVWNQEQTDIIKKDSFIGNEVLPTRTEKVVFNMSSRDFEIGQYWSELTSLDCFSSETLTFDVLEPGTLRADGVITGILSKVWVDTGETVPIYVGFKNLGQKDVNARFVGQVSLDGRILQVLESEFSNVPIGEVTNFSFFYTPNREGKHIVSGRVFYDNKRTFESSTIINAVRKKTGLSSFLMILVYLIIGAIIIALLNKIRKEKMRGLGYR